MTIVGGSVKRRAPEVVLAVDIGAGLQVLLDGLEISVGSIVGERTQFDRGLSTVLAEHLRSVGVGQF